MMFGFDTVIVQERASAGVCGEFVKFAFSDETHEKETALASRRNWYSFDCILAHSNFVKQR